MIRNSTREEFSTVGSEDGGWGACSKEFGRLLEAESSPQPTAGKNKGALSPTTRDGILPTPWKRLQMRARTALQHLDCVP